MALVTGAARGIGRALALGFAAEGAVVHVLDRDDAVDVHSVLPPHARGLSLQCDVADPAALAGAFSQLDRLDVLVNCAGITGWIDVLAPSEATWDAVVDTNLKGTFFCSVEAARLMKEGGGGSIVNVSTVVAARGFRNLSAYAASKGGINALTIQLACELAPYSIRVNAFAPPLIPLGRVGEPVDMIGPAVFLASDESAYVTAQLFYVDGGWSAMGRFPDTYVDAAARHQGGQE